MSKSAEYYPSRTAVARWRRQAGLVWFFAMLLVFLWTSAILSPGLAAAAGLPQIGEGPFWFFGHICHQIPERSFHFLGHQLAVCSRCFGVYFGLLFGLAIYPLWRSVENIDPLPRIWLFASMVPIGIDWSLGMLDIWQNNHASRFITGLILGVGCATYIMPALVEIVRNFTVPKAAP